MPTLPTRLLVGVLVFGALVALVVYLVATGDGGGGGTGGY
jgi:hypothetical protein